MIKLSMVDKNLDEYYVACISDLLKTCGNLDLLIKHFERKRKELRAKYANKKV